MTSWAPVSTTARPSEAVTCRECRVAIVGGNSAGQRRSGLALCVARHPAYTGSSLASSMSQYLISQLSKQPQR